MSRVFIATNNLFIYKYIHSIYINSIQDTRLPSVYQCVCLSVCIAQGIQTGQPQWQQTLPNGTRIIEPPLYFENQLCNVNFFLKFLMSQHKFEIWSYLKVLFLIFISRIMCHVSHVTCHLSHVTRANSHSHGPSSHYVSTAGLNGLQRPKNQLKPVWQSQTI